MRRSILYLSVLLLLGSILSCKDAFRGSTSTGRPYEILVVSDDTLSTGNNPIDTLTNILRSHVPGLPQYESAFKVIYTTNSQYTSVLKSVHNIIMLKISDKYAQPRLSFMSDVYASPQRILTVEAPDVASCTSYLWKNKQNIIDFFTEFEMNCRMDVLRQHHNITVSRKVTSLFGGDVFVPVDMRFIKTNRNFLWASNNSASANQNFVIYTYSVAGKNINYIAKRDSVVNVNISGGKKGSYMVTDINSVALSKRNIKGNDVTVLRGLWKMKGDFMGGPFVSYVYVDKSSSTAYALEVFVFSPSEKKCDLIRGLEASLRTFTVPWNNKITGNHHNNIENK